jgi:hypothetical protein
MTNNTQNLDNLASKVLFLTISFSRFGNFRKANVEINSTANDKRFKHQKQLLDSPELSMIVKRDNEVRKSVESMCLPYDIGVLLAPIANKDAIITVLDAYKKNERPELLKALYAVYTDQVNAAQSELKENFSALDYPSLTELAETFDFKYRFTSLQLPDDMKEQAHEMIMEAANGISLALATAAHELVSKLADQLAGDVDGKPKRLNDKAILKLQEFLNGFDIRNVTNHAELKKQMDKLKLITAGVDADKLRENDGLRTELQKEFSVAATTLSTLTTVKGRKFRTDVAVID